MASLIWGAIVVLFVLWVLGFAIYIGGGLVHIFLVIALVKPQRNWGRKRVHARRDNDQAACRSPPHLARSL